MADTHPGPSSLAYTPHSLLLVLRPKIWGIERLPRNLRPGQGVGVRVSRGKGETAVERAGEDRTGCGESGPHPQLSLYDVQCNSSLSFSYPHPKESCHVLGELGEGLL